MYRLWSLALIVTVVVLLVLLFSVGASGFSLSEEVGSIPLATITANPPPAEMTYRTFVPSVTGR